MMAAPCVYSVILNTNRCQDTLDCLASLRASRYPNQRVLVLDNASTDGSVPAIRSAFPEVEILALAENLGYAGNNNVGIQAALQQGAEWVFILNEDTTQAADCLDQLISVAESDPQIGIVGPLVYHADEPQVIQSAGGRLTWDWDAHHLGQNETDAGQFPAPHAVDWISGCAILVRAAAILQVGMLDARFFYYWEETEWCLRARRAGWKIVQAPAAHLWHKGVQRNYTPGPSVTYYSTRNRLMMMAKHRAPGWVWLVVWGGMLRTLASWSLRPKWRRSMAAQRAAMLAGLEDFLRGRTGRRPETR